MIQNILLYSIIHAFSTGGAIVIDGTDLTMEHGVFLMGGQCFRIGGLGSQITIMNTVS